ncbi:uncharacterized protein TNCV_3851961 [Trichonephila clavipes]|nr:uncharacterized protein TNCV_3851961 [Trichonephila clavipes]
MLKLKRGLTTDEIQKVLADLEDEIFDDSDCELENEEDDLDQSFNLNPEVVSEEQSKIVENEEDDLDQSLNLNPEVVSEEQSKIVENEEDDLDQSLNLNPEVVSEEQRSLNVRSGRGRKPVSTEAIEKVALQVEEDKASNVQASTSVHLVAEALDLPRSTVQKIMRNILRYYPYKLHLVQELLPHVFRD